MQIRAVGSLKGPMLPIYIQISHEKISPPWSDGPTYEWHAIGSRWRDIP